MKTKTVVGIAASVLIGLTLAAVPAVAYGAEYLTTNELTVDSPAAVVAVVEAPVASEARPIELTGAPTLITIWGATGVLLFGGAAVAVGASARRQHRVAV